MATFTVNADLGSWFANTLGGAGNGKGDRMTVGQGTGDWAWQNRFAVRFPRPTSQFAAIPSVDRITAVYAYFRASNDNTGIGGAPKFVLERATATFSENSESRRGFVNTSGPDASEWPGPATTTTDRGEYDGAAPSNGAWVKVDVTDLGKWFYSNASETTLRLHAKASNGSGTLDESATNRRLTVHSDNSTSKPYLEFVWSDNAPPNVATDLSPVSGTTQGSAAGTSLLLAMRHTDPEGDAATQDAFEVYPDSATDETPGTALKTLTTSASTAHNALRSRTITGLPLRTFVKWRGRFKDSFAWSPTWSNLQRVFTAYLPGVPVNLFVTPGTLTPDIFASLVSADTGDFITAARVVVEQVPAQGQVITKWDSGKQTIGGSSNRLQLPYGGSALVYGTQYRLTVWLWNRDDVMSPPTGYFQFTQREAVGPTITPGDAATKLDTLTPTFTLTAGGADMDAYRFRWYSPTGTLLHTVEQSVATTASIPVVTPAGLWDWGQDPKVDAEVRIAGNADYGPTAPQATLHINARPGSPYPLSASHGSAPVVLRSDGVYVVDTAQPIITLPFRDTDRDLGYTDNPTRREIELRNTSDTHVGASPYVITSGITDDWTVPAAILVAETTYKVRGAHLGGGR